MNAETIIFLAIAGTVLSLTLITFVLVVPWLQRRAALRRRINVLSGRDRALVRGQAGSGDERSSRRRDIQSRLREIERSQKKVPLVVRLRRELNQAGLRLSVRSFILACACFAVIVTAGYLLLGYPPLGALPVAICAGVGLPRLLIRRRSRKRTARFVREFANAIDVVVRGVRSGLPVGECLKVIATESPEPVAGVFREIVDAQSLGLGLEQGLDRALERMSTPELKFFAIVLSIQAQTGGNLAETLQNLSSILRERKKMADKVKALSSEARASASIIGSLPFLMTGLLYLVSPEYITPLFSEQIGQIMLVCGLAWMGIGVFIMKQMVSFEI